jgi:hypothetical protein
LKVLVVMAHRVNLCLYVAQFVDRLHLTGDSRTCTAELPTGPGVTLERAVLQRRNASEEEFRGVDVINPEAWPRNLEGMRALRFHHEASRVFRAPLLRCVSEQRRQCY